MAETPGTHTYNSIATDITPYSNSRKRVSDPSMSVLEVNIPEVSELRSDFVYNFHVPDERVSGAVLTQTGTNRDLSLKNTPRYVDLRWKSPVLSDFYTDKLRTGVSTQGADVSIEDADKEGKVVSEDNFFNLGHVTHTFSSSDVIEQGSTDIENYSRMRHGDIESVSKMSRQIQQALATNNGDDTATGDLIEAYRTLADFPKTSLGLRVLDKVTGKTTTDEDDLLRTLVKSTSLNVTINAAVIPDIFEHGKDKLEKSTYATLSAVHKSSQNNEEFTSTNTPVKLNPVRVRRADGQYDGYTSSPVRITGYIIDRYEATTSGFIKEKTFYIESYSITRFQDADVMYGKTYVYTVRSVAEVEVLSYGDSGQTVEYATLLVSSRPISTPIETYEHVPPPPPDFIDFNFDYVKRNLLLTWHMPVNSQRDVKQYQVFRRKSIDRPFELIAQIGFDDSIPVNPSAGRYKTGEKVDANNVDAMRSNRPDLVGLVKTYDTQVCVYVDEEFTVDIEQLTSSEYIYSVCSVDAHGMISNYSAQYHVVFDLYRNKLRTKTVCRSGSPRQYPNMNFVEDAFKDVIRVEGDIGRKMKLYCTPEFLCVSDNKNNKYNVLEVQTPEADSRNPIYLLQFINLDNQKMQLLRVNVKDSQKISKTKKPTTATGSSAVVENSVPVVTYYGTGRLRD